MLGRWEWIILELLFLGVLIAELVSVRRSIHRAKHQGSGQQEGPHRMGVAGQGSSGEATGEPAKGMTATGERIEATRKPPSR